MKDAGNLFYSAEFSAVRVAVPVVILHRKAEKEQLSVFILLSGEVIAEQTFHGIFCIFNGKAAALCDGVDCKPAVTGRNQVRGVHINGTALRSYFSGKKVVIRMKFTGFILAHIEPVLANKRLDSDAGYTAGQEKSSEF